MEGHLLKSLPGRAWGAGAPSQAPVRPHASSAAIKLLAHQKLLCMPRSVRWCAVSSPTEYHMSEASRSHQLAQFSAPTRAPRLPDGSNYAEGCFSLPRCFFLVSMVTCLSWRKPQLCVHVFPLQMGLEDNCISQCSEVNCPFT